LGFISSGPNHDLKKKMNILSRCRIIHESNSHSQPTVYIHVIYRRFY
jgi:hypothetical protein